MSSQICEAEGRETVSQAHLASVPPGTPVLSSSVQEESRSPGWFQEVHIASPPHNRHAVESVLGLSLGQAGVGGRVHTTCRLGTTRLLARPFRSRIPSKYSRPGALRHLQPRVSLGTGLGAPIAWKGQVSGGSCDALFKSLWENYFNVNISLRNT